MEYDHWKELFWNDIRFVTTEGFSYLNNCIDNIVEIVQNDAQYDNHKPGMNADFSSDVEQVRAFMENRARALENMTMYDQPSLSDMKIIPSFIEKGQSQVTVLATTTQAQRIDCMYSEDLDFNKLGDAFTSSRIMLYDDGLHGDEKRWGLDLWEHYPFVFRIQRSCTGRFRYKYAVISLEWISLY